MKRILMSGFLTALLYPLVNFVNGWSGSTALKMSSGLVLLSLIAGLITSITFGKMLSSKGWINERTVSYQAGYLLLTSFVIMAVFALVMLFMLGSLMIAGVPLPQYYLAIVRALTTVAGLSSTISMLLVLLFMPEPVQKPASAMQK